MCFKAWPNRETHVITFLKTWGPGRADCLGCLSQVLLRHIDRADGVPRTYEEQHGAAGIRLDVDVGMGWHGSIGLAVLSEAGLELAPCAAKFFCHVPATQPAHASAYENLKAFHSWTRGSLVFFVARCCQEMLLLYGRTWSRMVARNSQVAFNET